MCVGGGGGVGEEGKSRGQLEKILWWLKERVV